MKAVNGGTMGQNIRNWRIQVAIFISGGVLAFWQNCSQVGFQTIPDGTNSKVGTFDVVIPPSGGGGAGGSTNGGVGSGGTGSSNVITDNGSTPPSDGVVVTPPTPPSSGGEVTPPVADNSGGGHDGGKGNDYENDDSKDHDDDGESEEGDDGEDSDDGGKKCDIDAEDIVVNVDFSCGDAARESRLTPSLSGKVSLSKLVNEGVVVTADSDVSSNQLRMVFSSGGHYIQTSSGEKLDLVTSSHESSGFHLMVDEGKVEFKAGKKYRIRADALPQLKEQKKGCRLHPNWRGISVTPEQ